MKKVSISALLMTALSVGGAFYYDNFYGDYTITQEAEKTNAPINGYALPYETSNDFSAVIIDVSFNEDDSFNLKYTIKSINGKDPKSSINNFALSVYDSGSTSSDGRIQTFTSSNEDDLTVGQHIINNISIEKDLFEAGKSYDAYISWNEKDQDASSLFSSNPFTFTAPTIEWPDYEMTAQTGNSNAIVKFEIDFKNSEFEKWDIDQFFKYLHFNLYKKGESVSEKEIYIDSIFDSASTEEYQVSGGNVWTWDEENTTTTFYSLLDLDPSQEYQSTYSAIYNASNYSTSQVVTNDSIDELSGLSNRTNIDTLGKKYSARPEIAWQARTEEEPVTQDDFERVYIDFSMVAPDAWKDLENKIDSTVGKGYESELYLPNAVESVTVDNFYCEGELDENIDPVTISSTDFVNQLYGNSESVNGTLSIEGLKIDKNYKADLIVQYSDIFQGDDTKTTEISFSTISALPAPRIEYIGSEDPETFSDADEGEWTRNDLTFNLEAPAAYPNLPELIEANELYDSGIMTFTNLEGDDVIEADLSEAQVNNISYGENIIETDSILPRELHSQDKYSFTLDLTYSEKAATYFGLDEGSVVTVSGENVFTKNKVETPTLQIVKSDSVEGDRTKYQFDIAIVDSTGRYQEGLGSALTPSEIYEYLYLTITDESSNEVFHEEIPSSKLLLGTDGGNKFTISDLDLEATYNYEIGFEFNSDAIDDDYGWISNYEDDVLSGTFVTDDKFQPYSVIASIDEIAQNDLDERWHATYTFETLKGSETEEGFDNPLINQETNYSVVSADGNYNNSGTINFDSADSIEVTDSDGTVWYRYEFTVNDLPSDTIFTLTTETTYDESIISKINDTSINFSTDKNSSLNENNILVSWNNSDVLNAEAKNYYEGLKAEIEIINIDENTAKELNGVESITLWEERSSTPIATLSDSDGNFSVSQPKATFELDDTFAPGDSIAEAQYYFTIQTYDDYYPIDAHFELPEYNFAYLSKSNMKQVVTKVEPTSAEFAINITNYNNIDSIDFLIFEEGGDEIYKETVDGIFDEDDAGDTNFNVKLDPFTLNPNTTYHNEYTIHYKNVVEGAKTESGILGEVYKTPSKGQSFTSAYELTQESTESLNIHYDYDGYINSLNDEFNYKVETVELTLRDTSTDTQIMIFKDALSDFDLESGEGDYLIYNPTFIKTRHTYQLFERVDYNLGGEIYTGTNRSVSNEILVTSKAGSFTSEISYSQKNQNSISIRADYDNFVIDEFDPERAPVEYVTYEIYSGQSATGEPLGQLIFNKGNIVNGKESGTWIWEMDDKPEFIQPQMQYTISTKVKYLHDYNYDGIDYSSDKIKDLGTDTITMGYDDSDIEIELNQTGENTATINLDIENPNGFAFDQDQLIVSFKNSNRETIPVLIKTEEDSNIKYFKSNLDEKRIDIDDLEPYFDYYNESEDVNSYSINIYGIYLEYGDVATLQVEYNGNTFTDKYEQSDSPKLNPNSMIVQQRHEYESGEYLYEISIKHSSEVNLQEDVRVATYNTTAGLTDSNKNMLVVGEDEVNSNTDIDFDSNYLYLLVDSGTAEDDWRDVDFLVGHYLIVSSSNSRTIDFENESIYGINDFDMLPLPREPLSFFEVVLIILLVIALLLIIWYVIYRVLKYNDVNKWFEYAKGRADQYYNYHRTIIETYGWTHRYNDWQALNNMTIPQLKEYSKKINIPLPYKINKAEMVDILSLLNEAELVRVKDFTEHIIEIPQKVRDELLSEFRNSTKVKPKPPRRKFNYILDKAERMEEQGDEFKKEFKDYLVDFYIVFDKYFIEWTDFILTKIGLMEPKLEEVENDDQIIQEDIGDRVAFISDDIVEVEEDVIEEINVEDASDEDVNDDLDPETTNANDEDSITVPKNRKGGGS